VAEGVLRLSAATASAWVVGNSEWIGFRATSSTAHLADHVPRGWMAATFFYARPYIIHHIKGRRKKKATKVACICHSPKKSSYLVYFILFLFLFYFYLHFFLDFLSRFCFWALRNKGNSKTRENNSKKSI
jgi:hypothetical protein